MSLVARRAGMATSLALLLSGTAAFAADPPAIEIQAPAQSGLPVAFGEAARTDDGRVLVMVELNDAPAAVVWAATLESAAPGDTRATERAVSASRAQVQRIAAEQNRVATALQAAAIGARESYRVSRAFNGIAVAATPQSIASISRIPGVRRVLPLVAEHPTNSTSVPFLGTPTVWANTIGLPAAADGTGIRIGVIDTGVDYLHGQFGGTGVLADYQAELTDTAGFTTVGTATAGAFPTTKVVGGRDFAGDAYTGTNAPTADANPMDCGGHGSHVAGTAAGFGVTAAGATFTGPYDANPATYAPLRIGPGTAPKAQIYALRVFGCSGSTTLTTQAIDWSLDPNGDADLSDHLDVINMSLGSNFGSAISSSAISSDNAALVGVIVVASAGNASDTFFISGAPGSGGRVIATAASVDSGVQIPSLTINAPAGAAGNYLAGGAAFGPAPSGQTAAIVVASDPSDAAGPLTTDGCSALTNAAAIAGNIALIDRGTCGFAVKTKNAQNAGAIGVIIANNAPSAGGSPPGMAGVDATITIPSILVALNDANTLKANIAGLNGTLQSQAGSDTLASFSSRGPRRIAGSPLRLKPDIAAPGSNITSSQTGRTCTTPTANCTVAATASGFSAGSLPLTISGTSMAAPHMAGIMALLRQLKPNWSVEELKALAMNYAIHDTSLTPGGGLPRYLPSRIGGGRVDPPAAALADVVAMNAEDAGAVSVAFEPQVTGVVTQQKRVRLVNKGSTAQTFTLAFDQILSAPGVSFSLPSGGSVTVPANGSIEIPVQMNANRDQMDTNRDPALSALQGIQANFGDQPRNFLSESAAYLTFSQSATLKFRLPVYMAEKPSSTMAAADSIVTGGAPSGSTTIPLTGSGLCTGTLGAGPTCTGSFPTDIVSLVTPLELQVVSPLDPANATNGTDYADIQYAGVSYLPGSPSDINNDLVIFGVSSWGDWSTHNDVSYNICVDTNEDGVFDKSVINAVPSIFVANASANDNAVRVIQDLTTGGFTILGLGSFVNLVSPSVINSSLHLNNVMLLGATPSQLGMLAGDTNLRYRVSTCPQGNAGCARSTGANDHCSGAPGARFDQAAGPYSWNWAAQGVNFNGAFMAEDLNGDSLPVSWNTANLAANGSIGALLLHHHNASGTRAEVVTLDTAVRADLAIAKAVSPVTASYGQNVTLTLTASNAGPNTSTLVSVSDVLPPGLLYVSDNGAGAFSSATGIWTVGSLANGATASLQVVAQVTSTDPIPTLARISSADVPDPNPNNNQTSVTISAPRSSNLAITAAVSAPTVLVGGTVNYTLTVTNQGIDPAYSVNINEAFPIFPALNPTTFTASQGGYNPATGVWTLASLGNGASATLVMTVTAPNYAGALTLQATAGSTVSDPNSANNSASATTTVLSPAALASTKTVAGSFFPGSTVTYSVVVANTAATAQQDNPGDEFVDILPASLTLTGATATAGTAVATIGTNTVSWNGTVPGAGSVTITITATIPAATANGLVISNQGTVNFDADGNGTNEATAQTDDPGVAGVANPTNLTVNAQADLSVVLADSPDPVLAGTNLTLTATVTNAGPIPAAAAQVTLPLPAGTSYVSGSVAGGGSCVVGANIVCNLTNPLAVAASDVVTIVLAVSPGASDGSIIPNSAVVSSATVDPVLPNNTSTTSTAVLSSADVSITLTDVPDPVTAGANLTYTAVISNGGPSDAAAVTVTLPLPTDTTLVSGNVSGGGSCAGAPVVCSVTGIMGPGTQRTATIVVAVAPSVLSGSVLTTSATAASSTTDPTLANNTATATTAVITSADLVIGFSASTLQTLINVPLTFTANSQNLGPSDAQDVVITVTLTPDFRYSGHTAAGATCTSPQVGTTGAIVCTWSGATAPGVIRTLDVVAFSNVEGQTAVNASTSSSTSDPVNNNNASTLTVQVGYLIEEIPTLSALGLVLLGLMLGMLGFVAIRRQA